MNLSLIFCFSELKAEESPSVPEWNGSIYQNFFSPWHNPKQSQYKQIYTGAQFLLKKKVSESSRAKADFELGAFSSDSLHSHIYLREAFFEHSNQSETIRTQTRLGKQVFNWGKSDVIQPTDYFGAKDFSFFASDEYRKRLGVPAFNQNIALHSLELELTWVPVFIPNIPIESKEIAAQPFRPSSELDHSEGAIRLSYLGSQWDASLSLFKGWNRTPLLIINGPSLERGYHGLRAIGVDTSFSTENWVFKLESAYKVTENPNAQNALSPPNFVESVIGVEHPFWSNFRFQLQGVHRYYPKFYSLQDQQGILEGMLANQNAILHQYQYKNQTAATFRLSYLHPEQNFEAEIFYYIRLQDLDSFTRPKMSYKWDESFKTNIGLEYYAGKGNTFFGEIKNYSNAFIEGQYSF